MTGGFFEPCTRLFQSLLSFSSYIQYVEFVVCSHIYLSSGFLDAKFAVVSHWDVLELWQEHQGRGTHL